MKIGSRLVGLWLPLLLLSSAGTAADVAGTAGDIADPTTSHLSAEHVAWLSEVELLIRDTERTIFLGLVRDYQRDAFIEDFWRVRDPYPATSRNELAESWHNHEKASDEFDLADDRAPIARLFGPPDTRVVARCSGLLDPLEIWVYRNNYLVGSGFALAFVQPLGDRDGVYEIWDPSRGLGSLFVMVSPSDSRVAAIQISEGCLRGSELALNLTSAARWSEIESQLESVLHPDPEWVLAFSARSTDLPEGAFALPVEVFLDFPRRHQSRTVVQGLLSVPKDAATVGGAGDRVGYAFLVDGEVLRQGRLFDNFRYRFDLPEGSVEGERIPVLIERYLRPGAYDLIVKLEDVHGEAFFRQESTIEVPVVPWGRAPEMGPAALHIDLNSPLADAEWEPNEVAIEIGPIPAELVTGLIRLHAEVRGEVARVRFDLDDKPVLSKRNPPYDIELNIGRAPRVHTVRALALDADGKVLASDETAINAGPHRFAVRLVEPRANRPEGTPLRARAVVELPEGEHLDRLEFYLDETLLATLYQRPFVQPLLAPDDREVSYVRAVAYLAEGGSAEDIAFLQAPGEIAEVDVQLVELYTTVVDRRGRPMAGLTRDQFEIREAGNRQDIMRFEWMDDLPIHAGVLLDTSTSMLPVIDDAQQAALGFFEKLLTPRDRASVITFNNQPKLEVRFTSKVERLAGGLANISVEGETALYDSLIYALYYFSGVQGKRMLVIISDGEDSASRYAFEEVLEFARRAGVSIYSIGLNLPTGNHMARMALQSLAHETGGSSYFIESARELRSIYGKIEKELRSQYLLAYQSDQGDEEPDRYRIIEVEVSEPGLSARTLRGYYP